MKHCFVIDDSEIIRKFARLIFEGLNYRVSEAANPELAYGRLLHDQPDLLLLDWRIPGFNMHEVILKLRGVPGGQKPVLLYMISENDFADVQLALKVGANGYLLKPFNSDIVQMKLLELKSAA